jgi:hypothetical protein
VHHKSVIYRDLISGSYMMQKFKTKSQTGFATLKNLDDNVNINRALKSLKRI